MPPDAARARRPSPSSASPASLKRPWTRPKYSLTMSCKEPPLEARRNMIRPILRMGDPRLFERAKAVERYNTPELKELLADMRETMIAAHGAGLAAPQIGVGLRVV